MASRGFLRLWLVLALLWISFVAFVTYDGIFHPAFGELDLVDQRISRAVGWGLGVPVFFLILGSAIGWAVNGFRAKGY